jgi:hypothetical protein
VSVVDPVTEVKLVPAVELSVLRRMIVLCCVERVPFADGDAPAVTVSGGFEVPAYTDVVIPASIHRHWNDGCWTVEPLHSPIESLRYLSTVDLRLTHCHALAACS